MKHHSLFVLVLFSLSTPALAYLPSTHGLMSQAALDGSNIPNSHVLDDLGLPPYVAKPTFPDPGLFFGQSTVSVLIQNGAKFEDNDIRGLHHFFNPLTNSSIFVPLGFSDSPDFAQTADGDKSTITFSVKDARQYLWDATANPQYDYDYRQKQFGLLFETLGHTIHHLEDMAQPQHVRDDAHCDNPACWFIGKYNPSLYEAYSAQRNGQLTYGGYAPVFTTDAPGSFTVPLDFWTNANGTGIAQFTNPNFVSEGTNFDTFKFAAPVVSNFSTPTVTDIQALCTQFNVTCPTNLQGSLTFWGNDIADTLRPGSTTKNDYASTESLYSSDFKKLNGTPVYSLNRFNFVAAENILVPRAVGYATGFLNYFFRGKLDISAPPEGVYAVADAASAANFQQINLHIVNSSPSKEALSGGTLVAVVKYHKNTCHKDAPDLTGEYGSPEVPDLYACRSGSDGLSGEQIAVSQPISNFNLGPGGTGMDQSFDFGQSPIPVGSSDLYLQLVYRGPLGSEDDAVVVATKDISEPTYFAYENDTDYIAIAGNVYTRAEVNSNSRNPDKTTTLLQKVYPPSCVIKDANQTPIALADGCLLPIPIDQAWTVNGGNVVANVQGMQAQHFIRLVMLTDATPDPVLGDKVATCLPASGAIDPLVNQLDPVADVYNYSELSKWRGVNQWVAWSCVLNGDGTAPGSGDDRETVLNNNPLTGDQTTPLAVTIPQAPKYGQ